MPTTENMVIKEFHRELDRNKTWRIDWLGSVERRREAVFQHQVQVFLSPLVSGYRGHITDAEAAMQSQQRSVRIGVGYLPILYIGATFREGRPVGQLPHRFRRINLEQALDPSRSAYLPFDAQISRGQWRAPLPSAVYPSEFNLGSLAWRGAKNSRLLAIPDAQLVDSYYVLIPCIEVIRFFFCTSSLLATHLFSNAWSALIWEAGSSVENLPVDVTVGTHTVKGLQNVDGRHLAFMLTSEKTRTAVRMVHQALQVTTSAMNEVVALKCPFPFDEHTRIEAEVVEIPTRTSLQKRYLVTRLHRCQRPIPFSICYVNPVLNPNQGENHDSPDLIPMNIGPNRGSEPHETDGSGRFPVPTNAAEIRELGIIGDDQGRPGAFDEQIVIRVHEDRFPGLRDVPTALANKEFQRYRSVSGGARVLPMRVGQGSTADPGNGGNPVISSQLRTDESDDEIYHGTQSNIRLLLDSAQALRDLGFQAEALPLQRLRPQREVRPDSRSWAAVQIGGAAGSRMRNRVLACLDIQVDGRTIIVADIERRQRGASPQTFALAGFLLRQGISTQTLLYELTEAVSIHTGWPPATPPLGTRMPEPQAWDSMCRANHLRDISVQALAQRIYRFLIVPLLENAR